MGKSQKGETLVVMGTKNSQVLGVTQGGGANKQHLSFPHGFEIV